MANDQSPKKKRPELPRQDTIDFVTAFAVGTVLGVGATLLLTPERTRTERIARRLKPATRQMRRSVAQAREAVETGGEAVGDFSGELIATGRELLSEFRAEVAKIVEDARGDLQETIGGASKQIRKGGRRLGL
ncbi:hypothetical protein BH24GEM2_BH24GEM2_15740 [soil metagenome]|jgi:gas vesicle protein|nr:hypothetical protein [Gemmatimonadota bacterium]MDQ3520937.1 hypothetical protein [Gemmatimonadota bacterium]